VRSSRSANFVGAISHPLAFVSGDTANIRRLADHLGCSLDDAQAVYRLARRTGYASAQQTVFANAAKPRRSQRRQLTALKAPRSLVGSPRPGTGMAGGRAG
jgi:DNA-binding transcriptional MocR family regulator